VTTYTLFDGKRRIASGPLSDVALAVKRAVDGGADGPVLLFSDASGYPLDVDTRGTEASVLARLARPAETGTPDVEAPDAPRGRGRPKLGVVAREVTLLPRHWEWLATQTGGASVALRKLVDEARRANTEKDRIRQSHERAWRFMSALCGNMPGFEEASRALFANDPSRFAEHAAAWPEDVRAYATQLAFGGIE
jgi:uncharacterized protein